VKQRRAPRGPSALVDMLVLFLSKPNLQDEPITRPGEIVTDKSVRVYVSHTLGVSYMAGLSFRGSLPIFREKVYDGAYVFFLQEKSPKMRRGRAGRLLSDVGVSLIGRCLLRRTLRRIFTGAKKTKILRWRLYMGTFSFVTLNLREPPMEIGKLFGYVRKRFSLTHVLVLGFTPHFYRGKQQFLAKFSIGSVLFHNGKECGKTKKWVLISGYRSIST